MWYLKTAAFTVNAAYERVAAMFGLFFSRAPHLGGASPAPGMIWTGVHRRSELAPGVPMSMWAMGLLTPEQAAKQDELERPDEAIEKLGLFDILVHIFPIAVDRTRVDVQCGNIEVRDYFRGLLRAFAEHYPECAGEVAAVLDNATQDKTKRGAPRLEEREDWPQKMKAVEEYEGHIKRGVPKEAAARLTGYPVTTLERWRKRGRQ